MKKVYITALGSTPKLVEANTVADALKAGGFEGNYAVKVNSVAITDMNTQLEDSAFIVVGEKQKGGL